MHSACNAAETLLLHESTIESGLADKILRALRIAGVTLYGYKHNILFYQHAFSLVSNLLHFSGCRGERAMALGLAGEPAESMSTEYGDLRMSFEVVSGLQEAVDHIHQYGR